MAIAFLQEIRRQRSLILVFLAVILVTFLVIWFGILKREQIFLVPVPGARPERVEIDFTILQNPILKELTLFDIISVPEEIGRENPFVPYSPTAE